MSDYYRNHNQSSDPFQPPRNGAAEDAAPWDMPMDGLEMAQGMPAWQQPGVMGSGFLAEDPAPFGAEMQQSGVPLFQDAMDDDTFALYLKYHFFLCERRDMIGASHHVLDVLRKRT